MARRDREINIFNIAFLDVITGAMGAFVLLVVLLSQYVKTPQDKPQQQTERTTQHDLDRAQREIEQADQAVQTDDVERLKRLLAQARADLKEAQQQLSQLESELDKAEQDLQQSQAENEDLRRRLQRALVEEDQARRQVAVLQGLIGKSAPVANYWAMVDLVESAACHGVVLNPDKLPTFNSEPPPGLTGNDARHYVYGNITPVGVIPAFGGPPPTHWQYFISFSTIFARRYRFGVNAAAKTPAPPGCMLTVRLSYTDEETSGGMMMHYFELPDVALIGTAATLILALPATTVQDATPTADDRALWQNTGSGATK
ncbi:MAG TPA: hypothetical protein VH206_01400 [Xanthobacteraceae bacterium]|jgi:flagellar motor protein MotB|nr:hypothetical protein [Xanthobacteraceae bacterium]